MARTVLITGGAKGIGKAAAELFAREGYRVAINYHTSREAALELEQTLPDCKAFQADVSDGAQVCAMAREIFAWCGGIDVLVNNAGIAQISLFTDVEEAQWDRIFAVNVKGAYHCCQAVLPHMIQKKQGRIINVSSMWGICGASCEVAYSASKAAVIGLTKALAKEIGPSGITVNCVAPGLIMTDMNQGLGEEALEQIRQETPLETVGTPEDVARAIFFLAGEGGRFITGQVLSPNGGLVI